jgi:hypothetical protein
MIGRVKPVGVGGKPLKSELHHWWPRGLSRLWQDADGTVTQLAWNGRQRRAPAKQFGAITNAHHMKFGGPWSASIEPLFGDADTALPTVARKLEGLSYIEGQKGVAFDDRLTAHSIDAEVRKKLGEGVASLLVRCPAHRNMLHLTTERYWGRTGDHVLKHNDSLIAANIHQHYREVVGSLQRGGKIAVLRSGEREFVIGEGYLSTLVGLTTQLIYHCLVPLTPTLAILAFAPGRYRNLPPLCTIGLATEEVDYVNNVTQIYTRDYIYYRKSAPQLIDSFSTRQFGIVEFHRFPWLDALMKSIAMYSPTLEN